MAAFHVRDIPPEPLERLRERARRDGRSMNAEILAILERELDRPSPAECRREVHARAPDFASLEVANALTTATRAGVVTAREADEELDRVLHAPIERVATGLLARQALALSVVRGISAYDAAYLALGTDAILVTADRALAAHAERSALLPEEGPPG